MTHSCTGALEMAALLLRVGEGDEVIMPSYTFVSTANAFVLRGATPVFVDIRADTLNIDESSIERAITPRTRAIVVVHYAGVGCEMDRIMEIADRHGLLVIEDDAHIYYLLLPTEAARDHLIQRAASRGIQIVIHYVPLHASKAGLRYARVSGEVTNTENAARRLARLPLWIGMDDDSVADVSSSLLKPVSVVSPAILGGSPKTRHVVDAPAGNRS